MRACFDNLTTLEHVNSVCVHDRGQAVRDQDRNLTFGTRDFLDRIGDVLFGD